MELGLVGERMEELLNVIEAEPWLVDSIAMPWPVSCIKFCFGYFGVALYFSDYRHR